MHRTHILLGCLCMATIGCGAGPAGTDAGSFDAGNPDAGPSDAGSSDAGLTTIAAARAGNVTTPITVQAIVTGLAGVPGDFPQWYIEDPGGGPNSGVVVYCDPAFPAKCPTVRAPGLYALVQITGSLSTYMGSLQLIPTAQTVLKTATTPPPAEPLTLADMAENGNSMYRGVYVKLTNAELTVDDITPPALWDTECTSTVPAGPDAGTYGEPVDAGLLRACSSLCEPPAYSGFQVNDGQGHEGYIENPFFYYDSLQSSPECFTQPDTIPVYVGTTFTAMEGILDIDPYGGVQALFPVQNSSYTLHAPDAGTH